MKLIKVRDNKNRPINNLDVMVGAIFGDEVPKEFIVDKYYHAGERVYSFDSKGHLNVWVCNISGKFKLCKEPNFSEWSVNSVINEAQEKLKNLTVESNVDALMYVSNSGITPRNEYAEYDGQAHFNAFVDDFDLNNYGGRDDIVDIYLRREYSDHYLRKEDYHINGREISVSLPLEDMVDESNIDTKFLPLGYVISNEQMETKPYWYSEDRTAKTYDYTADGIQISDYDVVTEMGKSIEFGYKLAEIKITNVHTVVGSPLNPQLAKPVYRLDDFEIESHDPIGNNVSDDDEQMIEIRVDIEPDRNIYDIIRVGYSKSTQLVSIHSVNGYIQQVKCNITIRKDKPLSIFMIGSKANSPLTRFVKVLDEYGTVVEHAGGHFVRIPRFELLRFNSFEFELYVNRIFRSDYEEILDEETGELYIKMTDESEIDWDKDTFLFHIFYSITQEAAILKTHDQQEVTEDKEAFRLMLTSSYINKFQWMKMREDSKLIPPEFTVGSKNTASITNPDHYLQIGQTLKADVFTMVFKDNIARRIGSTTNLCNSESYPILSDTKELVVPFTDYNPIYDDFIIFKSGGVLVSASKWYLNGDHVNLYVHENPLKDGDYVDFRLLDRDDTVRVDNYFFNVNIENLTVDTGLDLSNTAFYMLFTISGEYISQSKYTVEHSESGDIITLKSESEECDQPYLPDIGSRVELIVGVYKQSYSKTLYKMIQIIATDEGQREFYLDESIEYNPASDNLLIFRKDGLYIGERFYHTDQTTGKIVIDKGSGVPLGSYIDILLIRNMSVKVVPGTEEEGA